MGRPAFRRFARPTGEPFHMSSRLPASLIAAGLLAAPVFAAPAAAGELVDRAAEAERLLADGNAVDALAELEAAFDIAWSEAPLGFSQALFVASRPHGFGIYEARQDARFQEGEDLLVYAEPYGFGYGRDGDLYKIQFDADFVLRTPTGQIIHGQENFSRLEMESRRPNKEFQVFITYSFTGLRPGDYVLATTLTDVNSGKVGTFDLPFTIVPPEEGTSPAEGAAEERTVPAEPAR